MEVFEIALLILAYTLGIVALFIELICYYRNLETRETIFLTVSILILIIALTVSYFFPPLDDKEETNIFVLIAMVLVGLATFVNTWEERRHTLNPIFKTAFLGFSCLLFVAILAGYALNLLQIFQYAVAIYLGSAIIFSMILIRVTKPEVRIQHREKIERITALACLIVLPITLAITYLVENNGTQIKVGFTFPMLFIFLVSGKLWDDIKRLSLFKPENKIKEQHLKNYAFTNREKEVIELLIKGATYKQTAETLFISIPTVKTHITNIYKKTGVNNKIELVALLSN